jgi:type IV pilus assembly protein PilC
MDENTRKIARTLSAEELSAFCLQMSYPVKAGISPVECIGMMLEETQSAGEKAILQPVYAELLAGAPLSNALEKPGCFPGYMIHMLSIGQLSGNLDRVLDGLVRYYAKEAGRAAAIKRAVTGPAVMLGVMAVLIVVLITQVLPVFNQVFQQMGVEMSGLATGLMRAGQAIQGAMAVIGIVLVVLAVAVFVAVRSKKGSAALSRFADRLFFRGQLSQALGRARFASAMSLMVSGGLDLDQSLERAEGLLEDNTLAPAVAACRGAVVKGEAFPKAAQDAGIFTGMLAGILSAGFKAGSFDQAIEELAVRCQSESEDMLERFVLRIEPALIVVLSVSVGLVLLSVMLPLISMLSSIGA